MAAPGNKDTLTVAVQENRVSDASPKDTTGADLVPDKEGETEAEHADHEDEDFRVFARYNWNESIYLTANTTTEDFSDNLRLGAGYSFAAFGSFYVEPNYTFNVSEDNDGERNGQLKLGLAYRF